MKLKSVYSTKTPYRNGGKSVNYTSDLELTSRIYEELIKLKNKKSSNSINKQANEIDSGL